MAAVRRRFETFTIRLFNIIKDKDTLKKRERLKSDNLAYLQDWNNINQSRVLNRRCRGFNRQTGTLNRQNGLLNRQYRAFNRQTRTLNRQSRFFLAFKHTLLLLSKQPFIYLNNN